MLDQEGALAVLRLALQEEMSGQRFYQDAAYSCVDPWAKEVFATLAGEEEEHVRMLLVQYQSLSEQGRWVPIDEALSSGAEVDITRMTFAGDGLESGALFSVEMEVDRRADDRDALALGIEMEQKAINLYRDQAAKSPDKAARQAYEFLVEEETRHYNQLCERWGALSPFMGG